MIGIYGIAKIGVDAITDAKVQYLRDTDLGIQTDFSKETYLVGREPAKGAIATMELIPTADQGGGYSSASPQPPGGYMSDNNSEKALQISGTDGSADVIFSATGGTGTGAAPIVAQVAKELGILTVAVVTKPFELEGSKRMKIAQEGIKELIEEKITKTKIPRIC